MTVKLTPEQVRALYERAQAFEANSGCCLLHGKDADGSAVGVFDGDQCTTIALLPAEGSMPVVFVCAEVPATHRDLVANGVLALLAAVAVDRRPAELWEPWQAAQMTLYQVPYQVLSRTLHSLTSGQDQVIN